MSLGRTLVMAGAFLLVTGVAILLTERTGIRLGQLPGDIVIRGKYGTVYIPITTCVVLSFVISAALWVMQRFR